MEFRVSVCLSRFFNDERSYSYIYLDKNYSTIGSFEAYLRRQFRLKDKFCLMNNNHLLPSSETTKIIQPGDLITVIPVKKDLWTEYDSELRLELENGSPEHADAIDGTSSEKTNKKKNKKKKQKPEMLESINNNDDDSIPVKKEKPDSIEVNGTTKRESDMEVSTGNEGDNEQRESIEQYNDSAGENTNEAELRNPKVADMQSVLNQLKLKALSMLPEVAAQKPVAGVSGGRINKRKRIRKRNKNSTLSVSTPDLSDSTASPPLSFKPVKKSASHIRFDADMSQNTTNTVRNPAVTTKPRIVHAIDSTPGPSSRRSSVSDISTVELILSNTKSDAGFNGKQQLQSEPTKSNFINVDTFRKRLTEFPVMDDVYPVPKDLILFKMLKIGDNYCPTVSDFILATVLEVDKLKGVVKVSIVDGQEECIPVKGKFDIDRNNEVDTTDKMIIDILWNQVSEPRLVFP